jgi:hypothetical protein
MDLTETIDAEVEECERLEALAIEEEARAELRESIDAAYDEWEREESVPSTYRQGA